MHRDLDLVRKILLTVEANEPPAELKLEVVGHTPTAVDYHVGLLAQARLLNATAVHSLIGTTWVNVALTWEGHEFLDAARSDDVWSKVKAAAEAAGGAAFETVKGLLVCYVEGKARKLLACGYGPAGNVSSACPECGTAAAAG